MSEEFGNMSDEAKSGAILDYVKGRASVDLAREIETCAETNTVVAEELAFYQGLAGAIAKPTTVASFDEMGWARLTREIDREEKAKQVPVAAI